MPSEARQGRGVGVWRGIYGGMVCIVHIFSRNKILEKYIFVWGLTFGARMCYTSSTKLTGGILPKPKTALAAKQAELKKELAGKPNKKQLEAARTLNKQLLREIEKLSKLKLEVDTSAKLWHDYALLMHNVHGTPVAGIGKVLGIERTMVSKYINSDTGKARAEMLFGETSPESAKKKLEQLLDVCIDIVAKTLTSGDPDFKTYRVGLAERTMDRLGVKVADKKETSHTHTIQVLRDSLESASKKAEANAPVNPLDLNDKEEPIGHA